MREGTGKGVLLSWKIFMPKAGSLKPYCTTTRVRSCSLSPLFVGMLDLFNNSLAHISAEIQ